MPPRESGTVLSVAGVTVVRGEGVVVMVSLRRTVTPLALVLALATACSRTRDRAVGEPEGNLHPGAGGEVTVLQGGSPTPP